MSRSSEKNGFSVGELSTYTNLFSEMVSSWLRNADDEECRQIVLSLLIVTKSCMSSLSDRDRTAINRLAESIHSSLNKL